MKHLLLILVLTGCGYDTDCIDGCDQPETVRGEAGATGARGAAGQDGKSCRLEPDGTEAVLTCDGVSFTIKHGSQGLQGLPGDVGPSGPVGGVGPAGADAVVEIIDPCGKQRADSFDEVLLRLGNGTLIGVYYKNGPKEAGLAVLGSGFYTTTDGTDCSFAVDALGEVTWNE